MEKRKKQVAHEDQRVSSITTKTPCNLYGIMSSLFHLLIFYKLCASPLVFLLPTRSWWLSSTQDVIRQTVEDRMKIDKERKEKEKKEAAAAGQKSALDRFRK